MFGKEFWRAAREALRGLLSILAQRIFNKKDKK